MTTQNQDPDLKQYVVLWERIANSGFLFVEADTPQEAVRKTSFNPKYVKCSAFEVKNHGVYIVGVAN